MKHIKLLKLAFLLTLSALSSAESIYHGLYTDHVNQGDFLEHNAVTMIRIDNGLTGGVMINSFMRPSIMFGYTSDNNKLFSFGALLATGYKPQDTVFTQHLDSTPVMPMFVGSLNVPVNKHVKLTANIINGIVLNAGATFIF